MISSSFMLRVISALVLGPLVLLAVFYGGFAFQAFVAISFGLSVKEWMAMARKGDHLVRDAILGIAYLVVCFMAFLKLRTELDQGLFLTISLMIGVWSSDIGAYFSGKFIGGAKLAPNISPNKTWAGFIGGMLGSAFVLGALNYFTPQLSQITGLNIVPFSSLKVAFVIGAFFTVFGQVGDLMISGYKRKVGVKNTGNLIPGHGGILDRIDSLLLVSVFFLIVLAELR